MLKVKLKAVRALTPYTHATEREITIIFAGGESFVHCQADDTDVLKDVGET